VTENQSLAIEQVQEFERLQGQLEGLHAEMQTLSRKSPNDLLNPFKLNLVNSVLKAANSLLNNKYRPFEDFSVFPEEQLPSNSDVMLILNQYLAAFETLRADNIVNRMGTWYWETTQPSTIRTGAPLKISKK
jgi:hypothetical protein